MSLLQEMLAVPNDPRMLHAAVVHTPIVLSMVGAVIAVAHVWTGGRNRTLQTIALVTFVALLGSAFAASQSGERAEGKVGKAPKPIRKLIHDHEEMAEKVWIFAALAAAGVAVGWRANKQVAAGGRMVAALAAVGCAGWVAVTAHLGGTLVYQHGVGAPKRGLAASDPESPASSSAPASDAIDPRLTHFRNAVWPILTESCIGCHEGEEPANNLDLTTMANLLRGGDGGPAALPGNADQSLLYRCVTWAEGAPQMPFREERLSDAKIAMLKRWIAEGAVWDVSVGAAGR